MKTFNGKGCFIFKKISKIVIISLNFRMFCLLFDDKFASKSNRIKLNGAFNFSYLVVGGGVVTSFMDRFCWFLACTPNLGGSFQKKKKKKKIEAVWPRTASFGLKNQHFCVLLWILTSSIPFFRINKVILGSLSKNYFSF